MKYWFLAALLANVLLLLVEFHYGVFESAEAPDTEPERGEKQISFPNKVKRDTGLKQAPNLARMPAENAGNVMEKDDASFITNAQPPLSAAKLPVAAGQSQANEKAVPQNYTSAPSIMEQPSAPISVQAPARTGVRAEANSTANANEENATSTGPASPPVTQAPAEPIVATEAATEGHAAFIMPNTKNTSDPEKNASDKTGVESSMTSENLQTTGQPQIALPVQAAVKSSEDRIASATPAKSSTVESPTPDNKAAPDVTKSNETTGAHPEPTAQQEPNKQGNMQTACYTVGPIKNAEALKVLLNRFRPQLTELKMSIKKTKKTRKRSSYLLYYPASSTMEKSLYNANILKNNYGIKDLQVFKDGEMKGAISLGVFGSEENAMLAKSQLEQKGVQAAIMPRFPTEGFYSVRMRWTDQQATATQQLSDALTKRYHNISRTESCE